MTRRVMLTGLLAAGVFGAGGCSDDVKKTEPKLAPGTRADPRLKPEQTGGQAAPQPAVKGD